MHSTSAMGLPRVVPEGGLHVSGKFFPEGTVLSVPSYTIHRDPEIWGDDVEVFRPERWFERDQAEIQKMFDPFSYGPRSVQPGNRSWVSLTKLTGVNDRGCAGRNLAKMELLISTATIFRRYTFVFEDFGKPVSNLTLTDPLQLRIYSLIGGHRRGRHPQTSFVSSRYEAKGGTTRGPHADLVNKIQARSTGEGSTILCPKYWNIFVGCVRTYRHGMQPYTYHIPLVGSY